MNKQQEFEAQLARDNEHVKSLLLNDPYEWAWLREFYNNHFDEIRGMLNNRNLRTVIEDYCHMEPSLCSALMENYLFVYQVNLAIYKNVLKKDNF